MVTGLVGVMSFLATPARNVPGCLRRNRHAADEEPSGNKLEKNFIARPRPVASGRSICRILHQIASVE